MKKYILKFSIIFFTITLINCSGTDELSKEQRLRQSITALENHFEERKLSKILEYVSEDYQDDQGRKIRDIRRVIQMQIMRHKSLYVFSAIKSVEWIDENAKVEIAAAMGGKPMESASILTSVRADMIKFSVDFVLEDDVYKVKGATWSWAVPSDFL